MRRDASVSIDDWIREAEDRRARSSTAGELFFALPERREASAEDLAADDAVTEYRRRWAANARTYRARRSQRLFHE